MKFATRFVCILMLAGPADLSPAAPANSAFQETASQPAVLPHCPIMTDQEVDPDIFVDWHGKRIYFCCGKCKRKFQQNPDDYAAVAAAFPVVDLSARGEPGAEARSEPGAPVSDDSESAEKREPFFPHLIRWLGRFHPATVHFPIGVLVAALLAELLFAWRGKPIFDQTARFCVVFGCIAGLLSGALGWFFAGFNIAEDDQLLTWHRWTGTGAAAGFVLLLVFSALLSRAIIHRVLFRITLVVVTCTVLLAGYLGGAMQWGVNHYAW